MWLRSYSVRCGTNLLFIVPPTPFCRLKLFVYHHPAPFLLSPVYNSVFPCFSQLLPELSHSVRNAVHIITSIFCLPYYTNTSFIRVYSYPNIPVITPAILTILP
jgi:hypothetical protein